MRKKCRKLFFFLFRRTLKKCPFRFSVYLPAGKHMTIWTTLIKRRKKMEKTELISDWNNFRIIINYYHYWIYFDYYATRKWINQILTTWLNKRHTLKVSDVTQERDWRRERVIFLHSEMRVYANTLNWC